jgi:hypothetical protein
MPGGMPYQLEKGPYFSVAESMLDFGGSAQQRLALLALMLAPEDPNQLPTLDSTTLDQGPLNTPDLRRDHMNTHWFGRTRDPASGVWHDQAPFNPAHPMSTGYWRNWYGDAGGIVAQTFIRAVEVSLGLDHVSRGTDVSKLKPQHCWPIEVFWRCPAPWFEGWVTWRRDDRDSGHVTVHLHTPGHHESALLLSPIRSAPNDTYPDYKLQPVHCDMDRGQWVIAHTHQETIAHYEVMNPSPPAEGKWVLPTFGPLYHSYGDIITVQPNEPDGGVRASGRAYTP